MTSYNVRANYLSIGLTNYFAPFGIENIPQFYRILSVVASVVFHWTKHLISEQTRTIGIEYNAHSNSLSMYRRGSYTYIYEGIARTYEALRFIGHLLMVHV